MSTTLQVKTIDADTSGYSISVVEQGDKKYVKLSQKIYTKSFDNYFEININPTVLHNIISVLQEYQKEHFKALKPRKRRTALERQKEIISRYLKGIPLEEIAQQFDCKRSELERILLNNNIELVDDKTNSYKKPPKPKWRKWRKRKKK